MKITVSFKNPDALDESIDESLKDLKVEGLSEEELEGVKETRKEEIKELCMKWFKWGEYLTVEIDTEAKTCTVVEAEKF